MLPVKPVECICLKELRQIVKKDQMSLPQFDKYNVMENENDKDINLK